MIIDFSDKVVIVTGAAGVLGSAVAQAFRSANAKLTCVDVASDRLDQLFKEAAKDPDHLLAASVDLTNQQDVTGMVRRTIETFGRVDVLVNTIGGFRTASLMDTTIESWDFMMNLNTRTAFMASREVIPYMLKQNSGIIIHLSARPGLQGRPNMAAYSASKSAVIRIVESLSDEVKDAGVRVNCIIPGTLDTPQNRMDMPESDPDKWVKPESLAQVILFLASDAARDITGVALPVYGKT